MCSYLIEEENNCCNDQTAYMEIMGNLGIHFSIKEKNVVGVALFLLVSLTETARVWPVHLEYSGIRRKCRTSSGAPLGPRNFAPWADTGKATLGKGFSHGLNVSRVLCCVFRPLQ